MSEIQTTAELSNQWALFRGKQENTNDLTPFHDEFDRWYKAARDDARAAAWDECAAAIAWCLANGSDAELDALLYVTENNPYRHESSDVPIPGASA